MKINFKLIFVLFFGILFFTSCEKSSDNEGTVSYFLSDIRPRYFESFNFESEAKVAELSSFINEFSQTYDKLESEYKAGLYTSQEDLENMRLVGMYYSFGLVGIVGGYMDGFIDFDDILGESKVGIFSNISSEEPDFEQKELKAMMKKAEEAAFLSINTNGYNDRSYGFYVCVRQVSEQLEHKNNYGDPVAQDSMIHYMSETIEDYQFTQLWNILMGMVTFTNYEDSLNTFRNPKMESVLASVNSRITPTSSPNTNINYTGILGPIYRMDLNMKKMDWIFQEREVFSEEDLQQINDFISTMDTLTTFVESSRKEIMDSWPHKNTYQQRLEKIDEIKAYRLSIAQGTSNLPAPVLAPFFNSKDFKQAYQCYSCHKPTGL